MQKNTANAEKEESSARKSTVSVESEDETTQQLNDVLQALNSNGKMESEMEHEKLTKAAMITKLKLKQLKERVVESEWDHEEVELGKSEREFWMELKVCEISINPE